MIGRSAAALLRALVPTLRWQEQGLDHWHGSALLICWHGQIVLGAALLLHLGRATDCLAPIVLEYGQSGPMGDFGRSLGLEPVPVPPYEQPEARRVALLTLGWRAQQEGRSLFMAADGHRGPRHVALPEPPWLAGELDLPLLPVALTSRPALPLPTWDRKHLPLPGSRVAAVVGAPIQSPTPQGVRAGLGELQQEARRLLG